MNVHGGDKMVYERKGNGGTKQSRECRENEPQRHREMDTLTAIRAVNPIRSNQKKFQIKAIPTTIVGLLAATVIFSTSSDSIDSSATLSNIPQTLSGEDGKKARIQRPKSRKAEKCTVKYVATCIRGGAGSPGEGPFNIIRPLVVFKEGFRTRHYCLLECSDICNLIKDGDEWP